MLRDRVLYVPLLVVAVTGTSLTVGAGVAGAAPAVPAAVARPVLATSDAALAAPPSPIAGYTVNLPKSKQSVAARVRVLPVTCNAPAGQVFVVIGLGSTTSNGFLGGLLQSGCKNNKPYYFVVALANTGAAGPTLAVAPGDVISVAVSAGTSPTATIVDTTAHTSVTGTTPAFTANRGQFSVQGDTPPFPTFSVYVLLKPTVAGAALSTFTSRRTNQVSPAGNVQLRSSGFTSTGSFKVRYVSQG